MTCTYAHIFRARGGQFVLVITRTPAITSDNVIEEQEFSSIRAAKDEAKALGAKPWNF